MPPKKVLTNSKQAPAKKRIAAKGFKLPDPIAPGQILTDLVKKQWRIGKSIGQGGFGEIYLASDKINKSVEDDANFVVKIEPHSNGPLFTELHCYMRIAKPEFIEAWKKERKMKSLGMPKFLGSGSLDYKGQKYRFMVMERFGSDLQKIIEKHKKKFSFKTVSTVAIQILEVLEYIHSFQYIHADIKASNLLVGFRPGTENQVFLVDYGLACRYSFDGKHKDYKYDQRKAHDGTIEFTSRDAHIGAHSRRGDLEILGYNLVQWLCGKLPWEDKLQDCNYVATQKRGHMEDVPHFMKKCFPDGIPPGIQQFMEYVASLTFDEKPNYEKCKTIIKEALKVRGYKDDGKLIFMSATPKPASKIPVSVLVGRKRAGKRRSEEEENISITCSPKKICMPDRLPCRPRNFNSQRKHTRTLPRKSMEGMSLSRVSQPEFIVDPEDVMIEKENLKMLEKKQKQRPKRLPLKKDNSLDNPTPQMLEIMAKIREKSISPPLCTKKHKHNGFCNIASRQSSISDEPPTELTPEMEAVIQRQNRRCSDNYSEISSPLSMSSSHSWTSSSRYGCTSPELFDSEEEDDAPNDVTVYYSPCGGGNDCTSDKHQNSATRNSSRKRTKSIVRTRAMTRTRNHSGIQTRSSTNASPEIL